MTLDRMVTKGHMANQKRSPTKRSSTKPITNRLKILVAKGDGALTLKVMWPFSHERLRDVAWQIKRLVSPHPLNLLPPYFQRSGFTVRGSWLLRLITAQKSRISSPNVTKSGGNWRNSQWKTSFFAQCNFGHGPCFWLKDPISFP